jgi:primosomal protein N'
MRIESSNYLSALEALRSANTNSSSQLDTTTTSSGEMDAYIPSKLEEEIPCENYNDIFSILSQSLQQTSSTITTTETSSVESSVSSLKSTYSLTDEELAAMLAQALHRPYKTDTDDTTKTDSTKAVDDTIKSIVSNISESLRCNEDTILSTLESLGLTPEDLLDSDNIELLANALNEGAAALGLPTVDDLDQTISDLTSYVDSSVSELESDYSLTDEELEAIIAQLRASHFEDSGTSITDILSALKASEEV